MKTLTEEINRVRYHSGDLILFSDGNMVAIGDYANETRTRIRKLERNGKRLTMEQLETIFKKINDLTIILN